MSRVLASYPLRSRAIPATKNPLVQRTNGSWYHLLVRGLAGSLIALRTGIRRPRDLLSMRYRASAARLASDVHVRLPARLTPSRARFGPVSDATPLGPRRG